MDISLHIYYLTKYAEKTQWQNATAELCQKVLSDILNESPSEESWLAVLELLGAWPNIDDIKLWVAELESQVDRWPWRVRQTILGQQHVRGNKQCVYQLVGFLKINNIEDTSGFKLEQWSQNEYWKNLKGVSLFKVETEAMHLAHFLSSKYLQNLHTLELKTLDTLSGKLDRVFGNVQLLDLKELNLISLCLKSSDISILSNTSIAKQIALLDLSGNFIYDADLPLLLNSVTFPNLEILDLSNTTINPEGIKTALASVQHRKLKKIMFKGTRASDVLGINALDVCRH